MINIIKTGIKKEIKILNDILKNIKIKKLESFSIDITNKTALNLNLNLPSQESYIYVIKACKPVEKDSLAENIKNMNYTSFSIFQEVV